MDSLDLDAICMGFESLNILILTFAWVFNWYPQNRCKYQQVFKTNPQNPLNKQQHISFALTESREFN